MMHTLKRYAAPLAIAMLLGAGLTTPTLAQTRQQNAEQVRQQQMRVNPTGERLAPWNTSVPAYANPSPYSCWEDQGYGRIISCDSAAGG